MAAGLTAGLVVLAGCSSDGTTAPTSDAATTILPDETALAPGACDPRDTLTAPVLDVAGTSVRATLGVGDFGCGGVNGDGYISFSYNPVLIEGSGPVVVHVDPDVAATVAWTGDQPFQEAESGRWTATMPADRCDRITIDVTARTGSAHATYGADVRSGGDSITCPQRDLALFDPSDTDAN